MSDANRQFAQALVEAINDRTYHAAGLYPHYADFVFFTQRSDIGTTVSGDGAIALASHEYKATLAQVETIMQQAASMHSMGQYHEAMELIKRGHDQVGFADYLRAWLSQWS